MVASFLADWSREARGSLFKSLTYGSVEKSSIGVGVWVPVCRGASAEEVSCGSGGEPDPGQRWPTGPCTRTAPSFLKGIGRRQMWQGARDIPHSSVGERSADPVYGGSSFIFLEGLIRMEWFGNSL